MSVLGFKDYSKQNNGSSQTFIIASSKLEDANLKSVIYEKYLPEKLPTDTLVLVRETGSLYVGTGSGIKKIADQIKVDSSNGQHIDLSEYIKTIDADNKYATKKDLSNIQTGPSGKSAYDIALETGYTGSKEDWIASLKGETGLSAYQAAVNVNLFKGSEQDWIKSLRGKSAFEIAEEEHGFYKGRESEWLESLKGKSAYDIAFAINGDIGSEQEWIASLKGKSAYEIAKNNGYEGNSEQEWIASLKGQDGVTPSTENFVQKEQLSEYVSLKVFNELKNAFEALKTKVEAMHSSP